jgi:membrane protein YdbS with pleckstrin-like domain
MVDTDTHTEPFSNRVIALDTLPTFEGVALEAISPRYRVINVSLSVAITLILVAIFTLIRWQPLVDVPSPLLLSYPYACMVVAVLGGLGALYHVFADVKIKYALREQDLCLQKGLIFRQLACQPILRVQHVETKRGPLTRLAGLASLQVFSAGGEYHTFEIPGLPVARAEQLRQFILNHKDVSAK